MVLAGCGYEGKNSGRHEATLNPKGLKSAEERHMLVSSLIRGTRKWMTADH